MVGNTMAAPASGSPETSVKTEGAADGGCTSADKAQAPGKGVVYIDFGRRKLYTIADENNEVLVFDSLSTMVETIRPSTIIMDNLPRTLLPIAADLGRKGIIFMRLKDLKRLADERKKNGFRKSDENDVRLLREIFRRDPNSFQPLFATLEELEVRALTELWVEEARLKKGAKQASTTTDDPLAAEIHRMHQRYTKRLARRIHEKAIRLPLYRRAVEELGLKGPALAYIVSHDTWALTTLSRSRLILRYQMTGRRKHRRRNTRSRLLIMLANTLVLNKHSRYTEVYRRHIDRTTSRKKRHWRAVLRVAEKVLVDLHNVAKR